MNQKTVEVRVTRFHLRFVGHVAVWLNESDIGVMMNVQGVVTAHSLLPAWENSRNDVKNWSYIFILDKKPVGQGFLFNFDMNNSCELGWYISGKFRRQGIGLAAHKALLAHAFEHLPLHSIKVVVDLNNEASLKVINALGYKKVSSRETEEEFQIERANFQGFFKQ